MLCLLLAFILSGCTGSAATGYVPPLIVTGDVEDSLTIRDRSVLEWSEVHKGDRRFQGVQLSSLVESLTPLSAEYSLLLTAPDGMTSVIQGDQLDFSYLVFSEENGWEAVHLYHPPSAAVKHLGKVVVVSTTREWKETVNVIRQGVNQLQFTPGQLYAQGLQQIPVSEGRSTQEVEGISYGVSVYTRRLGISMANLLGEDPSDHFLVISTQGQAIAGDRNGFMEWRGNSFRYVSLNQRITMENVAGIFVDPPETSITDLHSYVVEDLNQDRTVLIILLDGFGYHQYQLAREQGFIPFMSSLAEARPALAAYRPVTNAGMAAMLTGQWADIHGVYSREQREMNTPTIFKNVLDLGKQGVLLEGYIGILQTEIEPTLHMDLDGSGDSDDEIFTAAMDRIDTGLDLMMVHFHSIDDSGHDAGDLHPFAMETIRRNDDYVKELVNAWSGPVYILADHGMHSEGDAGYHGVFRYEDMVVPFIMAQGGM